MKILVIEDEVMLADSIRAMLEKRGFRVECVYDGESGAEYALTGIYDLLILDVMMPRLDGLQVAKQVRAQRCATPILMLSARSAVEDRIQGLNAGADHYLTKPFDSGELLASSRRMCSSGSTGRTPPAPAAEATAWVCPSPPRSRRTTGAPSAPRAKKVTIPSWLPCPPAGDHNLQKL